MVSAHLSIIPEFLEKIGLLGLEDVFSINKAEVFNKHWKIKKKLSNAISNNSINSLYEKLMIKYNCLLVVREFLESFFGL